MSDKTNLRQVVIEHTKDGKIDVYVWRYNGANHYDKFKSHHYFNASPKTVEMLTDLIRNETNNQPIIWFQDRGMNISWMFRSRIGARV